MESSNIINIYYNYYIFIYIKYGINWFNKRKREIKYGFFLEKNTFTKKIDLKRMLIFYTKVNTMSHLIVAIKDKVHEGG